MGNLASILADSTQPVSRAALAAIAATLDSAGIGCCVFDEDDCTVLWNSTMLGFFPEHKGHLYAGEPYRQNLERFYSQRLQPDELHLMPAHIEAGLQRHRTQTRPYAFQHGGRWVRVASLPVPGVGRIRIWTEVSAPRSPGQRDLDFESLVGKESLGPGEILQFMEQMAEGAIATDSMGRIQSVNRRFAELYGLPSVASAMGLRLDEIFEMAWKRVGDSSQGLYKQGADALTESLRFPGAPFELPLPGGRWVRAIEHKNVNGVSYSSHIDITGIKRQQLASEDATKFKSRFLATASHDLRQPVHSLGLMLEMLDQSMPRDEFESRLESIRNCTATLNEMLNGILDLSRFDMGIHNVEHKPVPIDGLFAEVRSLYGEEARRRGLAIECVDCGLVAISDPQLLRRMVFNLVANALKYSREGVVRVTCSLLDDKLALYVSDQGLGMSSEKASRIFVSNQRLRLQPEREADEGVGVGLTVVKLASDLLQHPIAVSSTEGVGTTFRITLPHHEALAEPELPVVSKDEHHAAEGNLVVFVEDDSYTLKSMSELIEQWGNRALSFSSPKAATQAMAGLDQTPGLIISDMHLNDEMDGLAVIASIRKSHGVHPIPAILLTGDLSAALHDRATQAGVRVVYKPVRPSSFKAFVEELLAPK